MYVVTNRIDVPEERAAAFEERFIGNMRSNLPNVQGLSRATLDRPVDPAAQYKVTMEFDSESDFEAWRDSEAFRASHARPAAAAPGTAGPASDAGTAGAPKPGAPRPATGPEHHIRIETYEGYRA
ncbi:antibiotic biosynthesis monooxygenase [Paeniglutamicibacter sp. ABSL32-1]|uniref:antibiotic biosynthesis monooxygenase family protein n=1 Tax=Paeniglutamicibacter quisquiliarum TaxID=2849498 RepID=UPI001C2D854A|nr:antibiotic biosynthesis monooxygenase [Paeniglutamicibacter quisquiliarum]MBV1779788.1 antibiotic biosynthesis monooxygenase [Paeniglutamicibacter quisquiliarum]